MEERQQHASMVKPLNETILKEAARVGFFCGASGVTRNSIRTCQCSRSVERSFSAILPFSPTHLYLTPLPCS
jgi:hypothetical protein